MKRRSSLKVTGIGLTAALGGCLGRAVDSVDSATGSDGDDCECDRSNEFGYASGDNDGEGSGDGSTGEESEDGSAGDASEDGDDGPNGGEDREGTRTTGMTLEVGDVSFPREEMFATVTAGDPSVQHPAVLTVTIKNRAESGRRFSFAGQHPLADLQGAHEDGDDRLALVPLDGTAHRFPDDAVPDEPVHEDCWRSDRPLEPTDETACVELESDEILVAKTYVLGTGDYDWCPTTGRYRFETTVEICDADAGPLELDFPVTVRRTVGSPEA